MKIINNYLHKCISYCDRKKTTDIFTLSESLHIFTDIPDKYKGKKVKIKFELQR